MSDRYAVFGDPIHHSKSPRIHALFAAQTAQDIDYQAQCVPAVDFERSVAEFAAAGGRGLNCTVPLKELAWQMVSQAPHHLTERARLAKAVNTLALQADGSWLGDNTDGIGLVNDLRHNGIVLQGKRLLILGAGGASRGVMLPLLDCQPASITIANRTIAKAEAMLADFASYGKLAASSFAQLSDCEFDVVLNATSASLNDQLPPLPDTLLADHACCYDLAYGNQPTAFVRWGQQHGAQQSLDGLGMLVEQAAEAFYLWRGVMPATSPVIQLLHSERHA